MQTWATDDGWPYPDALQDWEELGGEVDDDLLNIRAHHHLYDDLDALELQVVRARFGLQGSPVRTMQQLRMDTGLASADLQGALGSGLAKMRAHLT